MKPERQAKLRLLLRSTSQATLLANRTLPTIGFFEVLILKIQMEINFKEFLLKMRIAYSNL